MNDRQIYALEFNFPNELAFEEPKGEPVSISQNTWRFANCAFYVNSAISEQTG